MLETLRPTGFRLSEAANGLECLRQFELLRPHLVLMDLRMPEMDGHQAMRHLRARYAHSVRIIAVTASAFEEDAPEILRSGADQVVRKPYRLEELLGAIQRQLTALGADDRGFFPES
jgi:CheY-like chemotaxis protein